MSAPRICEGVFAINKPKSISSAQVLRELQRVFNPSKLFAPWLDTQRAERARESTYQRKRRRDKHLQVKVGHGGTLDPMATGVLIVGVGKGTKQLQSFLECTKSYEATVLFGAATDTYDALGKILQKAPYEHVTEANVAKAIGTFKGRIMQKPPLYSALRIQGKRLYEYAREGTEVPIEIQERPVEVKELEIVEWLNGGTHAYKWPSEEAELEEEVAEKVLHLQETSINPICASSSIDATQSGPPIGSKRKWISDEDDNLVKKTKPLSKQQEEDPRFSMSGALQNGCDRKIAVGKEINKNSGEGSPVEFEPLAKAEPNLPKGQTSAEDDISVEDEPAAETTANLNSPAPHVILSIDKGPPAVKLRMTVTSGFYVRSLSHDLGKSVGSLGVMSDLVRTRQGDFELGRNVLEYDDLAMGEDVWAPKVESMLTVWKGICVNDGGQSANEVP